jgi:hypothetical protein
MSFGTRIRQIRTRLYTSKINGKAAHLVQIGLRQCVYAWTYQCPAQRQATLQPGIDGYDCVRPHLAMNHQSP